MRCLENYIVKNIITHKIIDGRRLMPNIIEGQLLGEGRKFALIVSRFNDFISDGLWAELLMLCFAAVSKMKT